MGKFEIKAFTISAVGFLVSLSLSSSFVSSVPENLITDCMQDMTAGITMQARTTHFLAHDECKWDMNMSTIFLSLPSPSHLLLLSE